METSTKEEVPFRGYSLLPSARFVVDGCGICKVIGVIHSGYYCNDPISWFHKECVELPLEINHPFHPQHPLLLTHSGISQPFYPQRHPFLPPSSEFWNGRRCDICGQVLREYRYSCSTCDFIVDLSCGMKPPPSTIGHPNCHDHPLFLIEEKNEKDPCEVCNNSIREASYSCFECIVYFHVECAHLPKEVNNSCHSSHPLKLTASQSFKDDAKTCWICEEQVAGNTLYYCSICDYWVCIICTKSPPSLVIQNAKTHKHPLTFASRPVSCTCNICGVTDVMLPYMCLQCGFTVHTSCIDFPQVIMINRHDHRISFTHHLAHAYLKCGVCRKDVRQYKGAYSCLVCPNYAVHSMCIVHRYDVWDGVELEGKPEKVEDIAPFEVVGDDLIRHFSHDKHTLRLHTKKIIHDDSTRCEACCHPVGFDPFYSCEECSFILHENCANLPMKKRLVFHTLPFILQGPGNGIQKVLECLMCRKYFTGFVYKSQQRRPKDIDLHCSFFSEPFFHGGHSHPLYFFYQDQRQRCDSCFRKVPRPVLSCDVCEFKLCLRCASLPVKIKHRNDEHPLTLCCGEKANGKYWCDICETELDPSKWFYLCFDCGGTAHAECLIGDFSHLIPGSIIDYQGFKVEVVLNNHNTRPLCTWCSSRCKLSVILKHCPGNAVYYLCSRSCFQQHFRYCFM